MRYRTGRIKPGIIFAAIHVLIVLVILIGPPLLGIWSRT